MTMDALAGFVWEMLLDKHAGRQGRPRGTGLELKFPAVNRRGEAIGFKTLQKLWAFLAGKGWDLSLDPHYGWPVRASLPNKYCPDFIGTETGFCKLEISLAYCDNLHLLNRRLAEIRELLGEFAATEGVSFQGLGVQPLTPPGRELMMPKARNLFWEEVFGNDRVYLFTVTATNQVHVDVAPAEAIRAVNTFNALAAAQIALNANSTIWQGRLVEGYKALAEQAWEWWLPGDQRVGQTSRPFRDLGDYVDHLAGFRPVYLVRDGQYLGLAHYGSFADYWQAGSQAVAVDNQGQMVAVTPQIEDWEQHQTFCWHDARVSGYVTLENRVNCQQPPEDLLVVAALTLGLMENLDQAEAVSRRYSWEELAVAREEAIRGGLAACVAGRPITEFCAEVLEVAAGGLRRRQLGEERFLDPLWGRLEREQCPADGARQLFRQHGLEGVLDRFAWV